MLLDIIYAAGLLGMVALTFFLGVFYERHTGIKSTTGNKSRTQYPGRTVQTSTPIWMTERPTEGPLSIAHHQDKHKNDWDFSS